MTKRILVIALLIAFACVPIVYALNTATNARTASYSNGIESVVAQGDASSGATQEVDSNGYAKTIPGAKVGSWGAGDRSVKATAGTVYAVLASSSGAITAGDRVEIKNGTSTAGAIIIPLVFTSTLQSVSFTPAAGVEFDTGIYVDVTAASGNIQTTVVYE